MAAEVRAKPRPKRPTAAEKLAAAEAEITALRAQVAASAAPVPAGLARPALPVNGHAPPPPGVPPFEVMRFTTGKDDDSQPEQPEVRITLFSIDGRDYTIPAKPDFRIGLEASHVAASTPNLEFANSRSVDYILTAMLGEEGYAAFRGCKTVTKADFARVISVCQALTIGALEDPKG